MDRPLITPRGVLVAAAVVVTVLLARAIWSTLLIVAVALMFAAALAPWIDRLTRVGLPRWLAVVLIAVVLLVGAGFLALVLVPVLVGELRTLIDQFPAYRADLSHFLRDRHITKAADQVDAFQLQDLVPPSLIAQIGRGALGVVSTIASLALLTVYLLMDAHRVQDFVFYLLPEQQHPRARYLMHAVQTAVGGYIRGQLIISLCIFVFTFALLTVVKVPDVPALAALAFFGDMVPVIGVFVIILPMALAALKVSTTAAVVVSAALLAYTQFENNFLVQRVYGTTLDLPSSAVLIGILVGGALLGPAGALLSLPATATLAVLVRYWHEVQRGRDPALRAAAAPSGTAPPQPVDAPRRAAPNTPG